MIPKQVINHVLGSQRQQQCMWCARAFILILKKEKNEKVFSFLEKIQMQQHVAYPVIGLVKSAAFPGVVRCAFSCSLMVIPREIKFGHFCWSDGCCCIPDACRHCR